jgi:hypothetical protein
VAQDCAHAGDGVRSIIDYYLKPGGTYFGAKQGLKPVSIVYDYYATGDRSMASIHLVNQSLTPLSNVTASVTFINLHVSVKFNVSQEHLNINPISSTEGMAVPAFKGSSRHFSSVASLRAVTAACWPIMSTGSQPRTTIWDRRRPKMGSALRSGAGPTSPY